MTIRGLADLSDRVRNAAMVEANGEGLWPFETAADAINELTDTGHRVLGLDARERDDLGLATEIALSACEDATSPEKARLKALAALERAEAITGWLAPTF